MNFLWRNFWNCAKPCDAGIWVEPANVTTSLAFVLVAGLLWRLAITSDDPASRRVGMLLSVQTALVGAGSLTFHLFANGLGLIVVAAFMLLFVHTVLPLFLVRVLGWRIGWAAIAIGLFGVMQLIQRLFSNKVMWWHLVAAVGLLIIALLAKHHRVPARGEVYLAAIAVTVALTCYRLDLAASAFVPFGTHFLWHPGTATGLYLLAAVTICPIPVHRPVLIPEPALPLAPTGQTPS